MPQDEQGREEPRPSLLTEQVEVRAARPTAEDVAAFATTIDTDEIARRGEDLAAVLRRVPGARVREYGGIGRYATLSLRSSTAEQVTVMVDGVPQNRALGGAVDISSIPATQVSQVTVYRGFAPASAGLGGIGGLVDVRTRAPADGPAGQVDAIAGELDTARVSTGWSFAAGRRGRMRIGAEWIDSEGDFDYLDTRATPFDPSDDVTRSRDNNDVESGSLLFHGGWDEVGGGSLGVTARVQRREYGVPGADSLPATQARTDEDYQDVRLSWVQNRSGRFQGFELLADAFDQSLEFDDPDSEISFGVQDQTTEITGGGVASLVRAYAGRHRFLARLDVRHEDADVTDDALVISDRGGAERTLAALTVEDLILTGRFSVAPSLRWEYRRDRFQAGGGGLLPPPQDDVSEGNGSGKLGVAYQAGESCAVRGSVGRFFRNPNLLELFGDRGAVAGNPELQPEEGTAAEIGVACEGGSSASRLARGEARGAELKNGEGSPRGLDGPTGSDRHRAAVPVSWALQFVAFGRDVDDMIVLLPVNPATSKPQNLQSAEIRGIEASLALGLPGGFRVDASGTLQDASDESGGPTDGKPLVFQPEKLGYIGAGWQRKGLMTRWEVTYIGENPTDRLDTSFLRLPSRTLHDVDVSYTTQGGWSFGVDARNIFDEETRDVARFPLPGRLVFFHVGWRLGGASAGTGI